MTMASWQIKALGLLSFDGPFGCLCPPALTSSEQAFLHQCAPAAGGGLTLPEGTLQQGSDHSARLMGDLVLLLDDIPAWDAPLHYQRLQSLRICRDLLLPLARAPLRSWQQEMASSFTYQVVLLMNPHWHAQGMASRALRVATFQLTLLLVRFSTIDARYALRAAPGASGQQPLLPYELLLKEGAAFMEPQTTWALACTSRWGQFPPLLPRPSGHASAGAQAFSRKGIVFRIH